VTARDVANIVAGTVILVCTGLIFLPVGGNDKASAKKTACLNNMKMLAVATEIYRADADDRLPPQVWWRPLKQILGNPEFLGCPEVFTDASKEGGFAMNLPLVSLRYPEIRRPESTVLFFETDALGPGVVMNLAGRNRDRHKGKGSNVAYADTHVKFVFKDKEP